MSGEFAYRGVFPARPARLEYSPEAGEDGRLRMLDMRVFGEGDDWVRHIRTDAYGLVRDRDDFGFGHAWLTGAGLARDEVSGRISLDDAGLRDGAAAGDILSLRVRLPADRGRRARTERFRFVGGLYDEPGRWTAVHSAPVRLAEGPGCRVGWRRAAYTVKVAGVLYETEYALAKDGRVLRQRSLRGPMGAAAKALEVKDLGGGRQVLVLEMKAGGVERFAFRAGQFAGEAAEWFEQD